MRNWFPFTDYDFYGYLASGFVLLFAADYVLVEETLMLRQDWAFVEIVLVVSVAYFVGQMIASPSSLLLEHWLARRVLQSPLSLMLSAPPTRWIERFVGCCLVGRNYQPLPESTRSRISEKTAIADLGNDPEAVFAPAFVVARKNEDTCRRLDEFRNQYGLNRNMAFAVLCVAALFLGDSAIGGDRQSYLFSGLSLVFAVGLFVRFLKFYSSYAAEVLRTFAFSGPEPATGGPNEA